MLVQLKCVGYGSTAQYNKTALCTDLVEVFFIFTCTVCLVVSLILIHKHQIRGGNLHVAFSDLKTNITVQLTNKLISLL